MYRAELLEAKALEILVGLEEWATQELKLSSNEQLNVKICIEKRVATERVEISSDGVVKKGWRTLTDEDREVIRNRLAIRRVKGNLSHEEYEKIRNEIALERGLTTGQIGASCGWIEKSLRYRGEWK